MAARLNHDPPRSRFKIRFSRPGKARRTPRRSVSSEKLRLVDIKGKETLEMPRKTYLINLSEEDRAKFLEMNRKGSLKARQFKRAVILLKADEGLSDTQFGPDPQTLCGGWPGARLERRPTARAEATLIATPCTDSPERPAHGSLRRLAGKLVQLGVVEDDR